MITAGSIKARLMCLSAFGGVGNDVIAVVIGIVVYLALTFAFHPVVLGIPVMGG